MKLLHRFYAFLAGYFWLPCPKCGEMFGGHQVSFGSAHVTVQEADGQHMYCVCPDCDTEELRAENMAERQAQTAAWISNLMSSGQLKISLGEAQEKACFPNGR